MKPIKPVKIEAGQYRLGKLIVVKHPPTRRGDTTTWCRADNQGGGVLGYTLRDVKDLANTPGSLAFALARGKTFKP